MPAKKAGVGAKFFCFKIKEVAPFYYLVLVK